MAYQRATRLPDRYKVVFRDADGNRQRQFITRAEFERKDRDAYIKAMYSPGPGWMFWYVPFIETFDTPSGDLAAGQVWEGTNRHGVDVVVWKDESGDRQISKASDVVVTRKDGIPETIERKV